ncbi:MAG TPA: carboxypeptidase regulatory-like domain-containing protein [Candidatus Poseidoniales archaeon]|nr:carboxypeptidase regulatory-like domain-containing protein [Candidatus Poseidoniales archaeon]
MPVEPEQTEPEELLAMPPEEGATFESSGARIVLPSEQELHRRAMLAAFLALIAASAGIYVGFDYMDGEDGMYTHRQFIYAQSTSAPDASATLTGTLLLADGSPAANHTLTILVLSSGVVRTNTSSDGSFKMEGLDPGVAILDIESPDDSLLWRNRILLSPPASFEPTGFTHLKLQWPTDAEFKSGVNLNGRFWLLDLSESQRENSTEPYDLTAGAMYDMFGSLFIGLGVISITIALIGLKRKSTGLIRLAAITGFFSMGHLYVSCGFGLVAILLTMFLPRED